MELITPFELSTKPTQELHSLLRHAFNELAKSNADTHQRRNTLASIENIRREINTRKSFPLCNWERPV